MIGKWFLGYYTEKGEAWIVGLIVGLIVVVAICRLEERNKQTNEGGDCAEEWE